MRTASPFLALAFLAAACAGGGLGHLTDAGARVRASDGSHLDDCKFLGDDVDSQVSLHDAQVEVVNRAAAKGATHIVWLQLLPGPNALARGRAYRCPG